MNEQRDAGVASAQPVRKREIFGWAMYDFANSSYSTVVITAIYSPFFVAHIVPAESSTRDSYWSMGIIASTLLALVLAPFVGAICDYSGAKKKFLAFSTIACALSTMALVFVGPGQIWLALLWITLSNAAFMVGESFCASFLSDLATKKTMGMISGLGWALGYIGGLASLVLIMLTITAEPAADLGSYVAQNQWAMIYMGLFFLLASLPTFLLVRERSRPTPGYENAGFLRLTRAGFSELASSYKLARSYPVLFRFLIAFTVYMAGLEAIIKFVGIFATEELGFGAKELTLMFLIIQVSAALGALGFGFLEGKLGAKRTVMLSIAWWIAGTLLIYGLEPLSALFGMQPRDLFYVISVIAGSGLGSIQSSSRAVVGMLSPASRSAQMFGFWGLFNRLAVILGMAFGVASDAVGRGDAMLLVAGFFVLGGVLLHFVPLEQGIEEAARASVSGN